MRFLPSLFVAGACALAAVTFAPDAAACGGCFPPPGDTQSVVTDHRMILSVSKTQTSLYDQIQYAGSPEKFAWVLPISGTVEVGLSADTLFTALHNLTANVVQAPPTRCPPPPNCDYGDDRAASAGFQDAGSAPTGGVDVLKREVVGPYETVQLRSSDPNALTAWLTTNGFAVPDDIKPVIDQYVAEHFDFLALKLVPGQGVQAMRPVRITTVGASAVLPLRMVAAGTGSTVGVTLWVVGEGRYEPQNFPSFVIENKELVWDWATGTSNYKDLRAAKSAPLGGKGWELENSQALYRTQIQNIVANLGRVNPGAGDDYTPIEEGGVVVKTADEARAADLEALFTGIAQGAERVTRLRADLNRAALATDLLMTASADQSQIDNVRIPTQEKNQPICPVYDGCRQVGLAPRDEAIAQNEALNGGGESFACEVTKKDPSGTTAIGGIGAFMAFALVRARRARRHNTGKGNG